MKQAKRTFAGRTCLIALLALSLFLATLTFSTKPARAGVDNFCYYCGGATLCCFTPGLVMMMSDVTGLEVWYRMFYQTTIRPALGRMAHQWSDTIMMQARMIGGFFDAQNHSAAQLALQRLNAEAMRDYTPSENLCRFGSLSKSLAASDAIGRRTKIAIAERSQNRQMLNVNSNAAFTADREREPGRASDKQGRLAQFRQNFCDRTDNSGALAVVCAAAVTSPNLKRDIDYVRTLASPLTLNVDFSGAAAMTNDQRSLLALGSNLYGHDIILNRPDRDRLNPAHDQDASTAFMDYRTMIAKRSVAENSFASIAALKAAGTNASNTYMRAVMTDLGVSAADTDRLLGATNPSYYAQMEVLTKRLYQNPGFYAELMDKPANVLRQQAAMKSVSLMQQRDIYDSLQRSEMLLSVLLELQTTQAQGRLLDKSVK